MEESCRQRSPSAASTPQTPGLSLSDGRVTLRSKGQAGEISGTGLSSLTQVTAVPGLRVL